MTSWTYLKKKDELIQIKFHSIAVFEISDFFNIFEEHVVMACVIYVDSLWESSEIMFEEHVNVLFERQFLNIMFCVMGLVV